MWKQLATVGKDGSESGSIILDEEYNGGCRITLEKDTPSYAYVITCGVYGAMVHTTFADETDYMEIYSAMKQDLQQFMDTKTTFNEEMAFYVYFTGRYRHSNNAPPATDRLPGARLGCVFQPKNGRFADRGRRSAQIP